jgi:hypothetical protein
MSRVGASCRRPPDRHARWPGAIPDGAILDQQEIDCALFHYLILNLFFRIMLK